MRVFDAGFFLLLNRWFSFNARSGTFCYSRGAPNKAFERMPPFASFSKSPVAISMTESTK
jgi:hypothetical protein